MRLLRHTRVNWVTCKLTSTIGSL